MRKFAAVPGAGVSDVGLNAISGLGGLGVHEDHAMAVALEMSRKEHEKKANSSMVATAQTRGKRRSDDDTAPPASPSKKRKKKKKRSQEGEPQAAVLPPPLVPMPAPAPGPVAFGMPPQGMPPPGGLPPPQGMPASQGLPFPGMPPPGFFAVQAPPAGMMGPQPGMMGLQPTASFVPVGPPQGPVPPPKGFMQPPSGAWLPPQVAPAGSIPPPSAFASPPSRPTIQPQPQLPVPGLKLLPMQPRRQPKPTVHFANANTDEFASAQSQLSSDFDKKAATAGLSEGSEMFQDAPPPVVFMPPRDAPLAYVPFASLLDHENYSIKASYVSRQSRSPLSRRRILAGADEKAAKWTVSAETGTEEFPLEKDPGAIDFGTARHEPNIEFVRQRIELSRAKIVSTSSSPTGSTACGGTRRTFPTATCATFTHS